MTTDDRLAALERRVRGAEAQIKALTVLRRGDCAEIKKAQKMASNAIRLSARILGDRKS